LEKEAKIFDILNYAASIRREKLTNVSAILNIEFSPKIKPSLYFLRFKRPDECVPLLIFGSFVSTGKYTSIQIEKINVPGCFLSQLNAPPLRSSFLISNNHRRQAETTSFSFAIIVYINGLAGEMVS